MIVMSVVYQSYCCYCCFVVPQWNQHDRLYDNSLEKLVLAGAQLNAKRI